MLVFFDGVHLKIQYKYILNEKNQHLWSLKHAYSCRGVF